MGFHPIPACDEPPPISTCCLAGLPCLLASTYIPPAQLKPTPTLPAQTPNPRHCILIRATSHTRLRARDHPASSTLIGGKGGAAPSSLLHTMLEGPMERAWECKMDVNPAPRHKILGATLHTRLRARDHHASSTLIGGKGGAGSSLLLHNMLEGPTEATCECKMDVMSTWILTWHRMDHTHGHLDSFQKLSLGGRSDTKPGHHGNPNAHIC